jgi:hypothetical protein
MDSSTPADAFEAATLPFSSMRTAHCNACPFPPSDLICYRHSVIARRRRYTLTGAGWGTYRFAERK